MAAATDTPEPNTTAFTRVEVPAPTQQAVRFHKTGNVWWVVGRVWSVAVPLGIALSGLAARLRDWCFRRARRGVVARLLFLVAYLGLTTLIAFPINAYLGFARMHEYGLSTQSFPDWLLDELKEFGVTLVLSAPVFLLVYGLIARFPRTWWFWSGLLAFPAILFMVIVAPVWIDPIYNEFRPMRDSALEQRILGLARDCGIDVDRVFEVDMSRKTTAVNAYVTGLFGTKRIVLWDTLLRKLEPEQVLSVMGHEMGHYVLNHVVQGVVVVGGLVFAGLFLAQRILAHLVPGVARWTRVERLSDPASLPLALAVGHLLSLALSPVGFAFSRYTEHEADQFALELTRDNQAAATAFVALQRENLGYPRPSAWYQILRSTHPSLGERVDFCNRYRPWETGDALRFETQIRKGTD